MCIHVGKVIQSPSYSRGCSAAGTLKFLWCGVFSGVSYSLGRVLKLHQKAGLCLINRLPRESYRKSYGTSNSHSLADFRVTSSCSQASRNQKINKNDEKGSLT